MSRCRHEDIAKYERYISILENALSELGGCEGQLAGIGDKLTDISSNTSSAFEADNMSDILSALSSMDEDMINAKADCENTISDKMQELQMELESMRIEDEAFHEEERAAEEAAEAEVFANAVDGTK